MVQAQRLVALLLAAAAGFAPLAAAAQSWQPNKPIAIVIPFPPGPGLDLVARMVGDKLSAAVGQPVIYENRTGASGSIAAEYVARAAPDGYTLMAAATSTHATNVHLIKNLSYDPAKNFTPIVTSVETIGCIVVNTSVVPVNSVALREVLRLNSHTVPWNALVPLRNVALMTAPPARPYSALKLLVWTLNSSTASGESCTTWFEKPWLLVP